MRLDRDHDQVDRLPWPCESGDMELLRWQVGDATIFRIRHVDATPALQGLIRKFDPAAGSRAAWLTPNFIDEMGRLRRLLRRRLGRWSEDVVNCRGWCPR